MFEWSSSKAEGMGEGGGGGVLPGSVMPYFQKW